MEAKARIEGPDSLSALWRSFVELASRDALPDPMDNHSRKLLRLAEAGPVVLWLVAAQARWPALATRVDARIELEPLDGVERKGIGDRVVTSRRPRRTHDAGAYVRRALS